MPKDLSGSIVKKWIFVLAVHVQILENVQTMRLIFHAIASMVLWDQHVKPSTSVLENRVADMEVVSPKVTVTFVNAMEDTMVRIVK